ncbi:MAG TPA: NAD(P)/FAD-dependent oxidoreductase [Solirubrobacteraceae bacterium]|nr:NAD(P)/FAD-dependent oxidoreductase [Solirubrobacteraceae bacterium]
MSDYDAVVVGSGPNGLAAAITVARAGLSVLVREAADTVGGGTRSEQLTLPGLIHDVCSAVHPMALASPFFRELPLAEHGLELIQPPAPVAHPLNGGRALVLERSLEAAVETLGPDGRPYARLIGRTVEDWPQLEPALLGPILRLPRHPLALARFGLRGLVPSSRLASSVFRGEEARALFAGAAAHSVLPLERLGTGSFGIVFLALAHARGWPVARGGSQQIAAALASYLRSLGGEIETGSPVNALSELPRSRIVLCDIGPRQLARLAGARVPARYGRALERYRYGPGVFKLDYALDGPVPWDAPACSRAATVHVGGKLEEIAASERAPWEGQHADRPFVLVAQQSLFDPTRAPDGRQTLWAYCHVPNGSTFDMTERIESQIERFASGFRDRILARTVTNSADFEHRNANIVGGDINGGAANLRQLLARPTVSLDPYSTPIPGVYLCSASTPPGGGVHGMCGHLAARSALRRLGVSLTRSSAAAPTQE